MKKILLGATALLVASVAMAGEAPKAAVSGDAKSSIQSLSQTDDASRSRQSPADAGWRVTQGGGLTVSGTGKTDAGLSYGAAVKLDYIGGVSTNEAFVNFSGDWGKLVLGQDDSPAGDNYIGGQGVLAGTGGGWDGDTSLTNMNGASFSGTSDDAKVVYSLPSIAGVSIGVSLAPGIGGTYRNATEGSVSYGVDLGGAKVTLGGTYAQSKYNLVTNTNATPGAQEADFNNHRGYNYGVKVVAGAVSVAAGHTNHGKGGIAKVRSATGGASTNNGTLTSIGLGYDLGGGTAVGLGYATSRTSIVANANWKSSKSANFMTAGVTTAVAPGLSVFGELNSINGTNGRIVNGGFSGSEVIVGTKVSF